MRNACRGLLRFLFVSALLVSGCSSGEPPGDQPAAQSVSGGATASDTAQVSDAGNVNSVDTDSVDTSAGPASTSESAQTAQSKLKQIDVKSLPSIKGFSPPVDRGRVQVPLLADWSVPPRSAKWLFRLQRDKKQAYPQILVTADEDVPAEVEQLTQQNVAEFAARWQQRLDQTYDPKSFGERATPLQLGEKYAAECLLYVASEQSKQEQLLLKLVENGRGYTLELRALRGTLEGYRDSLYAVAAGFKVRTPMDHSGAQGFGDFSTGALQASDSALENTSENAPQNATPDKTSAD